MLPSISSQITQANRLRQIGQIDRAIVQYRQAIAFHPRSAWAYYYLGEAFIAKKCWNRATVCLRRAIAFNPSVAEFYNRLGEVYLKKNRLARAIKYFLKAIAQQPNSAWYRQNLAEALAQRGLWTASVSAYYDALRVNPQEVVKYDRHLDIEPDCPRDILVNNPIFIVGCGHSGTSIMLAILANHPHLYAIPYESALFLKTPSVIRATMQQWDRECLAAGKKRWIEKTPPHIFQIQKFLKYRPRSQFILMLRDGRDVVCSLKYRQKYKTFAERLDRWIYDNLAGLPYWDYPQVKVVKYEDLVSDADRVITEILKFINEKKYANILNYYLEQKHWYSSEINKPEAIQSLQDHKNLRNWQINQPLFDGRGRWQTEMSEAEKNSFKARAQSYLVRFGYVKDDSW